jgi:hypothetical protein
VSEIDPTTTKPCGNLPFISNVTSTLPVDLGGSDPTTCSPETYLFNNCKRNEVEAVIFLKRPKSWLLFGYDVPEKPSRMRVRVWRQLKALGALYPQMSFCILPDSDDVRSRLMKIESTMVTYGPRLVLEAKPTKAPHLQTLIALFRKDAGEEYRELAEECEEFLEEVKRNLRTGNVTQTEVFELEEALEGLERWFAKIKRRDFFGAKSGRTLALLRRCRNALLDFSESAQPKRLAHSPNRR